MALVKGVMYIFSGCTLEHDSLGDCAAFHIASRRWRVFPTQSPAPSLRSVYSATVFRQQILLFAGVVTEASETFSEVYVLDTAQIQWLPVTRHEAMGKQALSSLASDSGYASMGRIEQGNRS